MTLHLSIPDAKPETITEKQVRLWALHDKATGAERREIERQIGELEKRKPTGVLEHDRMRREP
jgi:hypothetical protein